MPVVARWAVILEAFEKTARIVYEHEDRAACEAVCEDLWERAHAGDQLAVIPAEYANGECEASYLAARQTVLH
jgi:hypothetical protein